MITSLNLVFEILYDKKLYKRSKKLFKISKQNLQLLSGQTPYEEGEGRRIAMNILT